MIWRSNRCMQLKELAWRLLPGSLTALVLGSLGQIGALKPAEDLAYNYLFQMRGATTWDSRVVVVSIDDNSIQRLGRYPWSRRYFTQLMQQLNQAQPSVVAFDVIFSESTPDDAGFLAAIEQHGRVVLAQAIDINGLPLMPVKPLRDASVGVDHIFQRIDGDGITRSIPRKFRGARGLSLEAVLAHGLEYQIPPIAQMEHSPEPFWLNWPGSVKKIRQYSFIDVLNNQVPAAELKGKIIFVGITATGFDTLSTPFDRNPPVTGVYMHATAAHNLLQQNDLKPLNRDWVALAFLVIMPGFGLLLSYLRTELQVVLSTACMGLVIVGAIGLLRVNYWLPMALPISLLVGTTAIVTLTERLRMNHFLQTQVRHLWQTYPTSTIPIAPLPDLGTQAQWQSLPNRWRGALPSSQPASIQVLSQLTEIAQQLGQSQATQIAIARNLSVGILAADQTGLVWFVNPPASQWLQVQTGDLLADCLSQGWLSSEDVQDLMTQDQTHFEREVLQNDRWFWLKLETMSLAESNLSNQTSHNLLLLIEDITTRKQIEENLAKQNQELQWISQVKDDFISTISHELRSPVTNMLIAIELLKVVPDHTQQLKYINQIEQECLRERDFINDLLNFQKSGVPDADLNQASIHLQTWLPVVVSPFQARAMTRQQTIECFFDPNLRPIHTSLISLERILKELLTNACKYTPSGQAICVKALRLESETEIAVQNFGSEIPLEELPRIFEKFYRIPKTDPWKQGGTGLGLAIVKRLVERMGATISVVSQTGYTQFLIRIPDQN